MMNTSCDSLEALRATDMWLRKLVDELEIDPEETAFEFDAVNDVTGQRRLLTRSTLAERRASNAALLETPPDAYPRRIP